jgi:enoyl-CoA hydratase
MPVELTRRGDVAVLPLNRPEGLNALSFAILGKTGEAEEGVAAFEEKRKPEIRDA